MPSVAGAGWIDPDALAHSAREASAFLKALAHETRLMIFASGRRREIGQRDRAGAWAATAGGVTAARAPAQRRPGGSAPRRQEHLLLAGAHRGARDHRGAASLLLQPAARAAVAGLQSRGERTARTYDPGWLRRNAAIPAWRSSGQVLGRGQLRLVAAGVDHAEKAERLAPGWRGTDARSSPARSPDRGSQPA